MNPNLVTKLYDALTAEERFALIFNAGVRGDDAEQKRLLSSAPRITLSMSHHAPYAEAFHEIAALVLLEVLDLAGEYFDALEMKQSAEEDNLDAVQDDDDNAGDEHDDDELTDDERADDEERDRCNDIFLGTGYLLKNKVAGWKLWCERRRLQPFRSWELMPGYARLQRALDLVENGACGRGAAFTPEGMLRWLNRARPAGEPELSKLPCTPEVTAAALESLFQERVRFHGGD